MRNDGNDRVRVASPAESPTRARVSIVFQAVAPATADTLLSLVKVTDGVAAAGATTVSVTAGKRLRITSMTFVVRAGAAAAAFAQFNVRTNAGVVVLASQSELRAEVGNTEAVIGAARQVTVEFPDGFELSDAQQIGVSAAAQAVTNVLSVALSGYEYTPGS